MQALVEAADAPEFPAEVVLVVANRADAAGLAFCRERGVPCVVIPSKAFGRDRRAHEERIDAALRAAGVQVVCLAGYMRLLTAYFVGAWAGRMLNIHPSLLPAYPGLETHKRVLAAGESRHGCTVHLVTEVMDEGPILGQAEVPVLAGDDEAGLGLRVLAAEHRLYPAVLAAFCRKMGLPEAAGAS